MKKIAFVGSRTFTNRVFMTHIIRSQIQLHKKELNAKNFKFDLEIVTGCADGADAIAREPLYSPPVCGIKVFKANWTLYGKAAGFIRNYEIALYSDECFAFVDRYLPFSRGTFDTVKNFVILDKPTVVYEVFKIKGKDLANKLTNDFIKATYL